MQANAQCECQQYLEPIARYINNWIISRHQALNSEKIYTILRGAITKDTRWQENLHCLDVEQQNWLWKLRTRQQQKTSCAGLFFWLKRVPWHQAIGIKKSLWPLWARPEANHCLLEYIICCASNPSLRNRGQVLQAAIDWARNSGLAFLDYYLNRNDLQGAALCRRLNFHLGSEPYHGWYLLSKKLS